MGAWGHAAFENDSALDWVATLEEFDDSTLLRETLERVTQLASNAYLEADPCCEAIAAAEIVAALLGRAADDLPDEVSAWAEARRGRHEKSLAPLALAALKRIRTSSELKELWEESGADDWNASLDELERRLTA